MKKIGLSIYLTGLVIISLFGQDLKIKDVANYFSGNWYIIGLIENTSSSAFSYVDLGFTGYDKNKNIVHTDSTYAYAPIPPYSTIPFRFLISKDDSEGVSNFNIEINDYNDGASGSFGFKFGQLSITERNSSFVKYSGEIENIGTGIAKYVDVGLLGFDSNDKLVYFDTTYPKKSTLAPNAKSIIEFLVPPELSQKIKKYRLLGYSD